MKTLKFKSHLAEMILSGEKSLTWRLLDDKNLEVGDKLDFINRDSDEVFAQAEIVDVVEKTLGEVTDEDYEGHKKYKSDEEMLKTYKNYYGSTVTLESPLKVIKFKLL